MAHKRVLSFKYALEGIWSSFKEEPNIKFHFLAGIVATLLGAYFKISQSQWLSLIICIGLVISVELTNTAIEEVVDSFTPEVHPAAKRAKDVSAAAVLVVSIMALVIGLIIFLPHFRTFV